ncbi:hypothetical protein Dimus_037299 [Dionaea muscipula]
MERVDYRSKHGAAATEDRARAGREVAAAAEASNEAVTERDSRGGYRARQPSDSGCDNQRGGRARSRLGFGRASQTRLPEAAAEASTRLRSRGEHTVVEWWSRRWSGMCTLGFSRRLSGRRVPRRQGWEMNNARKLWKSYSSDNNVKVVRLLQFTASCAVFSVCV